MSEQETPVTCAACGKNVVPAERHGNAVCPECGQPFAVGRVRRRRAGIEELLEASGPYSVKSEIARGGMGVVYRVADKALKRDVAVKVLLSGPGAAEEDLRRFYREAQAAARLRHSNIVSIHAVGEVDGQPYIVMDYIEGENLADLIDSGAVNPRRALDIAEQVADALHYAHLRGVVHRDIKPGNILVDNIGRAQLMDFGLAKRLDERTQLTRTGTTVGTPAYMPPEQAEGLLEKVDARSDVYSLGAVLYEMITGRQPFTGENTMAILMKVLEEEPIPPRSINPRINRDVETICLKAMAKQRQRRYASALEMAGDIRRFKSGEAVTARPPGRWQRAIDYLRRRLPVVTALASALLAALLTAGYFFYQGHGNLTAELALRRERASANLQEARQLLDEGSAEEALELLKEARLLAPGLQNLHTLLEQARITVLENKIRRYLDLAERFMEQEQYLAAEAVYQLVLDEFDADNPEARRGLRAARGTGTLSVSTDPAGVSLSLVPLMKDGRRGNPVFLGSAPLAGIEVEMGVYGLVIGPVGEPVQEIPFRVGRQENVTLDVRLSPPGTPPNMIPLPENGRTICYVDRFEYPNRWGLPPLAGVTYLEASARCRGKGKRLCTLEEWKAACSGDEGRAFPYGRRYRAEACNTGNPLEGRIAPSGSFPFCVSSAGIYDMSGNVAEWVESRGKPVTAGGNWAQSLERNVSCSSTRFYEPGRGWESVGFRCCMDVKK